MERVLSAAADEPSVKEEKVADTVNKELDEALEALAEREARIKELEDSIAASDHASQLDELKSELDVALAEKKTAEDRAEAAEAEVVNIHEFLKQEASKAELVEERTETIRALDVLSDERIEARAADWAAMTAEEFDAVVEDLKSVRAPEAESTLPEKSALTASATKDEGYSRGEDFALIANLRSKSANLASI